MIPEKVQEIRGRGQEVQAIVSTRGGGGQQVQATRDVINTQLQVTRGAGGWQVV